MASAIFGKSADIGLERLPTTGLMEAAEWWIRTQTTVEVMDLG